MAHEPPPQVLFKYMPLGGNNATELRRRVVQVIREHKIWFADPTSFNDPFDCAPPWQAPSPSEARRFARERAAAAGASRFERRVAARNMRRQKRLTDEEVSARMNAIIAKAGVCSLSANGANPLMWSHYAAAHAGVCFAFVTDIIPGRPNPFTIAFEVNYTEDRPVARAGMGNAIVDTILLTKSSHWEYEQEWRTIDWRQGGGLRDFPPTALGAIALGARIADSDSEAIVTAVRSRLDPMTVLQAKLDSRKFGLRFEEVDWRAT